MHYGLIGVTQRAEEVLIELALNDPCVLEYGSRNIFAGHVTSVGFSLHCAACYCILMWCLNLNFATS